MCRGNRLGHSSGGGQANTPVVPPQPQSPERRIGASQHPTAHRGCFTCQLGNQQPLRVATPPRLPQARPPHAWRGLSAYETKISCAWSLLFNHARPRARARTGRCTPRPGQRTALVPARALPALPVRRPDDSARFVDRTPLARLFTLPATDADLDATRRRPAVDADVTDDRRARDADVAVTRRRGAAAAAAASVSAVLACGAVDRAAGSRPTDPTCGSAPEGNDACDCLLMCC